MSAASWTFLTNHARVLLCIAHDPGVRLRDIAARLDITERSAYGIVTDLAQAGYIVKQRTAAATATRSRRTSRCQSPQAGSAPWARFWPSSPATTRRRERPGAISSLAATWLLSGGGAEARQAGASRTAELRACRRRVAVAATAGEGVRGWRPRADSRDRAAVSRASSSVPWRARAIARRAGVNLRLGSASCHASAQASRAAAAPRSSPASAGTRGGPGCLFAGPGCAWQLARSAAALPYWAPRAPVDAAWTVGKFARWRWSPVISSTWATCGETAAKRRKPPSSPARRAVLTSTASPVASQKLTLDRSMTSRLEPGRRKLRSCSRSAGALAMSSSPASSAMVMPPALWAERSRPR